VSVASGPILIWGAGAIGGTLGAAFSRAGESVVLVDSEPAHVEAVNAGGLKIEGPIFREAVPLPAFLPETLEGRFVRAFLCVKAHHTEAAAAALAPHLAPDGFVVSAQNGLNELAIAEAVGRERTIGCFVNFGADYLAPGTVHYSGHGAVVVGELDGGRTARIAALHRLLQAFEPKAVLTGNIWGFLWGKLVYGALLFATALTPESIADVLAAPRHRAVLTAFGREVGAVAQAQGIRLESFDGFDPGAFLPDAPPARTERSFSDMVAHNRASAKSHSGIWRDLAVRKRKTEVDAQLLPVVAAGERLGLTTPLTSRVVAMIHEIESGARPLSEANLDELASLLPASVAAE
jgi:2-dehydropantoate 2-reductase